MKSKFLSAAAVFVMAGSVSAADFYDPYVAGGASSASAWGGFYGGVHLGITSGAYDTLLATPSSSFEMDATGVSGGLFGGYNWQFNQIVLGLEGDFTLTHLDDGSLISAVSYNGSTDWKLSGRGRVRYALDNFMPYTTAGLSYADVEINRAGVKDDNASFGWTIGAGGDVKLTDKLFARGEYLYSDHSKESFNLGATSAQSEFTDHTVRLGLGYQF